MAGLLLGALACPALAAAPAIPHNPMMHMDAIQLAAVSTLPENEGFTAPPMVDPRTVETQPLAPSDPHAFRPVETTLDPLPVLVLSGTASWDDAYDSLVKAFRTLDEEREKLGLKRAGEQIVVYQSSDENGFEFEAQLPFSGATTGKPSGNIRLGASHAGKVFIFRHNGSFADMDNTYELIANYLDEKNVEAKDLYLERYRTDLVTSRPEALEIEVIVPAP
ncbi:GyrI-like domain-containing protein [Xanthobacter sp. TB0136]|uniref:GyrI-like domain-containing protein n=1 Tax=Xanthobacter sp. TB0136 TaxID=3459177 RepID=UPI00403A1E4A